MRANLERIFWFLAGLIVWVVLGGAMGWVLAVVRERVQSVGQPKRPDATILTNGDERSGGG